MLKNLGQWLRVAGYDVLILPDGTADRELFTLAQQQGRLLLTRDRKMKEYRNADAVVMLLDCNDLDDCVADLNRKLQINWLYKPFSRCKQCNTELIEADQKEIHNVPEQARNALTRMCYCPVCRQLFWDGSHVKRMQKRLQRWQESDSPE
jgi:uncharacterized protein with PIN domain